MSDELIIFSGLDQSLPDGDKQKQIIEIIEDRLNDIIKEGDINKASTLVKELIAVTKLSGRSLARVLYVLDSNWDVFQIDDETFQEWAYRVTGLHSHTISRYIKVEELFNNPAVPDEVKADLQSRNIGEAIPIANMIAQGYEPDANQWDEIISQPDATGIRNVIRDVKDTPPRASALIIMMDSSGSLWATKDGVRRFVGSLEVSDDDAIVQMAIERIKKNSGVLG